MARMVYLWYALLSIGILLSLAVAVSPRRFWRALVGLFAPGAPPSEDSPVVVMIRRHIAIAIAAVLAGMMTWLPFFYP